MICSSLAQAGAEDNHQSPRVRGARHHREAATWHAAVPRGLEDTHLRCREGRGGRAASEDDSARPRRGAEAHCRRGASQRPVLRHASNDRASRCRGSVHGRHGSPAGLPPGASRRLTRNRHRPAHARTLHSILCRPLEPDLLGVREGSGRRGHCDSGPRPHRPRGRPPTSSSEARALALSTSGWTSRGWHVLSIGRCPFPFRRPLCREERRGCFAHGDGRRRRQGTLGGAGGEPVEGRHCPGSSRLRRVRDASGSHRVA